MPTLKGFTCSLVGTDTTKATDSLQCQEHGTVINSSGDQAVCHAEVVPGGFEIVLQEEEESNEADMLDFILV